MQGLDLKDTQLVYGLVANIKYTPFLQIQATLPDKGGILSPWAGVLCARSMVAKHYDPPIQGEMVALLLTDQGESALCLGTVFSQADVNPVFEHRFVKRFDDGSEIDYDLKEHHLTVKSVGKITIEADDTITIKAPDITLKAPDIKLDGETTTTEDVIIKKKSFLKHTHAGVMAGSSKTSKPS